MPDIQAPQGGLLTLDLAGVTGVAYGPLTWTMPWFDDVHLGGKLSTEDERLGRFRTEIRRMLGEYRPARLVLEAPLPLPVLAGRWMTNQAAVYQQLGLRALARCEAWHQSVPVAEISADLVRQEILGFNRVPGKPDGIKSAVYHWCRGRGLKVPSHNAADACLIWFWHKRRLEAPQQLALGEVA